MRIGFLVAEGQQIHDQFTFVMAGVRRERPGKDPKNRRAFHAHYSVAVHDRAA